MQIKVNYNKLFWIFNISGWLLFFSIEIFLNLKYYSIFAHFIEFFSVVFFAFILSCIMRKIYQQIMLKNIKIIKIILIIILVTLMASYIRMFVNLLIESYFCTKSPDFQTNLQTNFKFISSEFRFIKRPFTLAYPLLIWSLLYFALKIWFELTEEREKREKALLLAQQSQLQMLRYQLNPHFLFNSLGSIQALMYENRNLADKMITELSEFLRYTLSHVNKTYVPFKEELEAIKKYFSIEKIRFEEKLEYDIKCSSEAENYKVLSFLIQPLIENAIKHGIKTSSIPLKILIDAKVENAKLCIEISNTGKWLNHTEGTGISNMKDRLSNAYNNRFSFEIIKELDKVIIKLELEHLEN